MYILTGNQLSWKIRKESMTLVAVCLLLASLIWIPDVKVFSESFTLILKIISSLILLVLGVGIELDIIDFPYLEYKKGATSEEKEWYDFSIKLLLALIFVEIISVFILPVISQIITVGFSFMAMVITTVAIIKGNRGKLQLGCFSVSLLIFWSGIGEILIGQIVGAIIVLLVALAMEITVTASILLGDNN